MTFVAFPKNIVITFVFFTYTLIRNKQKIPMNRLMSIVDLPGFIFAVIIAHILSHISTTFLDPAILVTGRLLSF